MDIGPGLHAVALVICLTGAGGAPAQEATRYRLYLHDAPPAAEEPVEESPARRERRWRDPARPTQPSRRVAYCNDRLHSGLDRCQANFGFGSPTYFRCERDIYRRFGADCTER